MKLELTLEEAKAILHCLTRTNARNTNGVLDLSEKVEDRLSDLIAEEELTHLVKPEPSNGLDIGPSLEGLVIIHIDTEQGPDLFFMLESDFDDIVGIYGHDDIIDKTERETPLYTGDDMINDIHMMGSPILPNFFLTEIF